MRSSLLSCGTSPSSVPEQTGALMRLDGAGLWRRLEFHIYLSIMHEVAEITPRSAQLPGKGTPINTAPTALPFTLPLFPNPIYHRCAWTPGSASVSATLTVGWPEPPFAIHGCGQLMMPLGHRRAFFKMHSCLLVTAHILGLLQSNKCRGF